MKNSPLKLTLYSTIGVLAVLGMLIAINVIAKGARLRVDLTENKIYTLTEGTRNILDQIDTPVTVRFYVSERDNAMPVFLRNYASRVNDLLQEYRDASNGMIEIIKIDPQPDTEAEDSANLDGVPGQPISMESQVYLGLSVTCVDQKVAIPFISPDRENLLEYDISRAISQAITVEKPLLGILTPLPMFGESPMMMNPMMQQQPAPAWIVIRELERDYEVRQLAPDVTQIDEDITVLLVLHPHSLTPQIEYAIDQFLMRGGNLLAAVDPLSLAAKFTSGGGNPMMPTPTATSDLPGLIPAWGLKFDSSQAVADPTFRTSLSRGAAPESFPTVLSLTPEGINRDDAITSQLDNLLFLFSGAIEGTPAEGLEMETLVTTTQAAGFVPAMQAEMEGAGIMNSLAPAGEALPLAVRLTGKFSSAFPDGQPAQQDPEAEQAAPPENAGHRTESEGSPLVILFADVDFLYDEFAADVRNILGQQLVIPRNGNLDLFLNSVELLSGDENLIQVRSRGAIQRPFTRIRQMETEAEERFRATIQRLEQELQETQQRLSQLQTDQDAGQQFIISPEQQAEIDSFQQKRADVRTELTETRRSLRRDIDSLETRLKWLNIAGMPALIVIIGAATAITRRRKTSAR